MPNNHEQHLRPIQTVLRQARHNQAHFKSSLALSLKQDLTINLHHYPFKKISQGKSKSLAPCNISTQTLQKIQQHNLPSLDQNMIQAAYINSATIPSQVSCNNQAILHHPASNEHSNHHPNIFNHLANHLAYHCANTDQPTTSQQTSNPAPHLGKASFLTLALLRWVFIFFFTISLCRSYQYVA